MGGPLDVLYRAYERRLEHELTRGPVPHHVGLILDGNRRWAAAMGYRSAAEGHRRGAAKIDELLGWCRDLEIDVVTLWLLSTENLEREPEEVEALLEIIVRKVEQLATEGVWRVRCSGALELLPTEMHERLAVAARAASHDPAQPLLNIAVGYGGRREIIDAVRRLLETYADEGMTVSEAAKKVSATDVERHLYTAGLPDPDLVIRTSGEVRLSGFLMWQSAHSEFYFCDPYWPDFRRIDFLRAVRAYQQRQRRFGH